MVIPAENPQLSLVFDGHKDHRNVTSSQLAEKSRFLFTNAVQPNPFFP